MTSTFMHAIFCDDLRHEMGNKYSYMGVYSGAMFIPGYPYTLPKLGVTFWLIDKSGQAIKDLSFIVYLDETEIGRVDIPIDEPMEIKLATDDDTGEKARIVNGGLIISPLLIEKDCRLKARAFLNGEEIKGGTLVIRAADQVMTTE